MVKKSFFQVTTHQARLCMIFTVLQNRVFHGRGRSQALKNHRERIRILQVSFARSFFFLIFFFFSFLLF